MPYTKEMRAAKMRELNAVRGRMLAQAYARAPKEAREELGGLKKDPLFVAGVVLYGAKGDAKAEGPITFTTAVPALARVFGQFLVGVCAIPEGKVRMHLLLYPGVDEWLAKIHWAREAGLPARNFTKCSRISGKGREGEFGFCTLTVSNAYLKCKLRTWITELPKQLIDRR